MKHSFRITTQEGQSRKVNMRYHVNKTVKSRQMETEDPDALEYGLYVTLTIFRENTRMRVAMNGVKLFARRDLSDLQQGEKLQFIRQFQDLVQASIIHELKKNKDLFSLAGFGQRLTKYNIWLPVEDKSRNQEEYEIVILPNLFQAIIEDKKRFVICEGLRDYEVGDILIISEFDLEKREITGRKTKAKITYIENIELFNSIALSF